MPAVSRPFEDPAAVAAKLLNRLGLAILVIASPCIGVFSAQALYALMPIGAMLILIAAVLRGDARPVRFLQAFISPIGALVLGLICWALLSLIWTLTPEPAGERFLKTVGAGLLATLAASFLPEKTKTSNLNLIPIGLFVTLFAMLGLIVTRGPDGTGDPETPLLQRSIITMVLLIWPALGVLSLRERWLTAGGLATLVALTAIASWARIPLLAVAIGSLTFTFAMSRPILAGGCASIVFALLFAAAPALVFLARGFVRLTGWGQDLAQPLVIWADLMSSDGLRVITGHGVVMAARGVVMGYLPADVSTSLMFELWYDLGLVGAWTFAALTWLAFRAAAQTPPSVAPALLAGLVSGLTIAVFGLATEQIWWVTLVGVDAIAFASLVKGAQRSKRLRAQAMIDEN
jgi:hypothetical protein